MNQAAISKLQLLPVFQEILIAAPSLKQSIMYVSFSGLYLGVRRESYETFVR